MNLSIIIVNWNVRDLLKKCLESIYRETKDISFEVFVIDNASSDGSAEIVRENFPEVKLIVNAKNEGFAKANNQGIKESGGEYILLLNPDTEIFSNVFLKMIEVFKEDKKLGILGPKLLNPDKSLQSSIRRFPTLFSQTLILLKIHHLLPDLKTFKKYFARDFDYSREQSVDQVMGACFMVKRRMLEQIGFLDKKFYIWFEEVDYCKRAKKAGWNIAYTPNAEVIHYGGRSFQQKLSLEKQKMFNKSLRYYFRKHHGFLSWLWLLLINPKSLALAWLAGKTKDSG